jgi:glutamate racemase
VLVVKIALLDSGIGLLPAAAAVRRANPHAGLVLSIDPDGMPWGPRDADDIVTHALACARAAAKYAPAALIAACNTASVHALPQLRAELEPAIPVIGTVPAVKPAAAGGGPVAIWATPATTGSSYQRGLIERFGNGAQITGVPCHGLADAVESGEERAIDAAIAAAAALTPPGVRAVVLGCTHYELVAGRIRAAVSPPDGPPPEFYGSAEAVAAQALRRAGEAGRSGAAEPPEPARTDAEPVGEVTVLHSGRPGSLPEVAFTYAEGRLLGAAPALP